MLTVGILLSTALGCAADPNDAADAVEQKTSAGPDTADGMAKP